VPDDPALATLDESELALLQSLGTLRTVAAGDYLYREGDVNEEFFVVLSGAVEIVIDADGREDVIARHDAGRFLGELNLLSGARMFVSARVTEGGVRVTCAGC